MLTRQHFYRRDIFDGKIYINERMEEEIKSYASNGKKKSFYIYLHGALLLQSLCSLTFVRFSLPTTHIESLLKREINIIRIFCN